MPLPSILNPSRALPKLLLCLFLCTATWQAAAQVGSGNSSKNSSGAGSETSSATGSGKGVQLVQRVDDVLYGVDPISLAILSSRYVSGVMVRVNANQPSPVLGYSHFVAD